MFDPDMKNAMWKGLREGMDESGRGGGLNKRVGRAGKGREGDSNHFLRGNFRELARTGSGRGRKRVGQTVRKLLREKIQIDLNKNYDLITNL